MADEPELPDDAPPAPPPPAPWRNESTEGLPAAAKVSPRRRVAIGTLLFLAVGLITYGGLLWLRPLPRPTLFVWSPNEYPRLPFGSIPFAAQDRNALAEAPWFNVKPLQLAELADVGPQETIVLSLSGRATCDDKGRVLLLADEAEPGSSKASVPLAKILAALKECRARHRLVIVDLFWPSEDPYLADVIHDLPRRVLEELDRIADDKRLVLLSCQSGQIPHASPDLGRSVFSHYLDEGLRGWSDFEDSPLDDRGQVTARRLAHFVQSRVERWVMLNRDAWQTPILVGDSADFPLVALPRGEPVERRALPAAPAYPAWLIAGWKVRQRWQREDRPRVAAWLGRQLDTALLEAERAWAVGGDDAKVQAILRMEIDRIEKTYAPLAALPTPEPLSLAEAGVVADPVLIKSLQDVLKKIDEAQRKNAKAEEAAAAIAKILDEFTPTLRKQPPLAVEAAVFAAASHDPFPRRGAILTYERFLAEAAPWDGSLPRPEMSPAGKASPTPLDGSETRPTPRFVETLTLRRLADLAATSGDAQWPVRTVRKVLELTRRSARADSRAQASQWLRESVEIAAQKRHTAEFLFYARGFAPLAEADKALDDALSAYQALLAKQDSLDRGQQTLTDALARLPWLARLANAGANVDANWTPAINAAIALAESSYLDPAARPQVRLDDIAFQSNSLRTLLDNSAATERPDAVAELIKQAKGPDGNAEHYRRLEALLLVPWIEAERRVEIWGTCRDLGGRLARRTADRDLDDQQKRPPTPLKTGDAAPLTEELGRVRGRVDRALDLLRLACTKANQIETLSRQRDAILPAEMKAAPSAFIYGLQEALQQTWTQFLPTQWIEEPHVGRRQQMASVWPGWLRPAGQTHAFVEATAAPWRRARVEQWGWQGAFDRFESHDPDAPAFYARAAFALRDFAPPEGPQLLFPAKATPLEITPARPTLQAAIPLRFVVVASDNRGAPAARLLGAAGLLEPATKSVAASVILPDDEWLRVSLDKDRVEIPKVSSTLPLAVTATLRPGAELSTAPRPLGFLVRLENGPRSMFHKVILPYLPNPERVELILSGNPQQPAAPFADLRLRPSKGKQPFFVFVRNGTDKARNLQAELRVNQQLVPGGAVSLTVGARQTARIPFPGVPLDKAPKKEKDEGAPPPVDLPPLEGPLNLRVVDKETNETLAEREVKVTQASPREYVRVPSIRFEPADAKKKNRLEVTVRAAGNLTGPPCVVELVLPPRRIPGLKAVRDGVFRGELTAPGQEVKLYASDIDFEPGSDEEGVAYLNIDGIPRAIIFRVTYARFGEPTTPREDDRPAMRIVSDRYFRTGSRWEGVVEVDNPPTGSKLEISLGRYSGGAFEAEMKHTPLPARQKGIGFGIRPSDGALEFEPFTRDWLVNFDSVPVRGERILHARLLSDAEQDVVPRVDHAVVFDDQVPDRVAFIDLPKQAQLGKTLTLLATGQDKGAGIKDVTFFVGATGDDRKIPASAAKVIGEPVPGKDDIWMGKLPMPGDKKGPVEVGVQFTNRVGLSAFAKGVVELVDFDPIKNAPGTIQGEVVEGDIPQGSLTVALLDAKGNKLAETKTIADGTFAFQKLPPGKYTLVCEKPAAGRRRRAIREVNVEPGQTARVRLELTL